MATIGEVIKHLKSGQRACREGWNGKGMWIALVPDFIGYKGKSFDQESEPYIALYIADGKWQPGWLASQPDLLADDWILLDDDLQQIEYDEPLSVSGMIDRLTKAKEEGFGDSIVQLFDPDTDDWQSVTLLTYGGSSKCVRLYCDEP